VSSYLSFKRANDRIAEASGGRLIIETHPGDSIVPADTELDAINKGTLDAAHNTPGNWASIWAVSPMFNKMVAGPTAGEYYFWYIVGPGMDLMKEMFASKNYNAVPLAVDGEVPEVFLYTAAPVNSPSDLEGKKYRLLGDEASIFAKLGVSAIATPSGEIYEAMQRGVIDGFQHGNLALDWEMAFYEVVDYAYMSGIRQPTDVFCYYVNADSWAELPDDLKAIVEEVYWAEGIRHYGEWAYKATQATADWQAEGVQVLPMDPSVEDALVAAANEYYADMAAKDPFYAKVLESLQNWRDDFKTSFPRL
jgi:TRAP-type mannitol/chloroaromatic compound transport system substrate-binding protein